MIRVVALLACVFSGGVQAETWLDYQLALMGRLGTSCQETEEARTCQAFRNYSQKLVPFGSRENLIDALLLGGQLDVHNKDEIVWSLEAIENLQRKTAPHLLIKPSFKIGDEPVYNEHD